MKSLLFAAAATAACLTLGESAKAQVVTYYYAPAAPVVSYAPVAVPAAAPVVYTTRYAPAYTVPRPVVTTVAPAAVVRTRYRPFVGRSVTRVRYRYAPVTYYAY